MSQLTQKLRYTLALLLSGAVLLTYFTNCDGYSPEAVEATTALASLDCDDDCITPNADNLELKVNLANNGVEYGVSANLTEWNLGGDCNEGGYPHNRIRYELYQNGQMVRNSDMAVNGVVPTTQCVSGRFLLYINLSAIPSDVNPGLNRSGLSVGGGARGPYDLYVEIYGLNSQADGAPKRNAGKGRYRVSLLPL